MENKKTLIKFYQAVISYVGGKCILCLKMMDAFVVESSIREGKTLWIVERLWNLRDNILHI